MTAQVVALRDLQPIGVGTSVSNETTMLSSDPRITEFFGVQAPASGMVVNATTAQRVATVYACVTKIAGGISTMPLRIYERTWDAKSGHYQRRPVDDMELWWLLNESPCAGYTAASHWEWATQNVLLRGDGFTELRRQGSGRVSEMVPHPWSAVTPLKRRGGRLLYTISDGYDTRVVDQDDVLHFTGFGFDGERSPSVISMAARQAIGNALAMDEYSGKFFAGGAHHNMVLETDKKMDPDKIVALQRAYGEKHSGLQNAHTKPLVLTEGMTAKAVTMSAEDAQLLEGRRFQVTDICRAFGVPPHMVGESSASTTWGSGLEALGRAFVTYVLQPHLVRNEQELNRKLFRTPRFFIEYDRSALTTGDSKAQADADKAALGGPGAGPGSKSVNEIRRRNNLPPIDDPKYDVPYWPEAKAAGGASPKPKADIEPGEDE
ncbi:MAG: phage portal protein [Rubrivivax sp.]|nr:MAG: phage portal protein [Rubrivivax sp.]